MKFLVSPEFTSKLPALSAADLHAISGFLGAAQSAEGRDDLLRVRDLDITNLGENVYVHRSGSARLYFTFGSDSEGQYVLLLDATSESGSKGRTEFFAPKSPRTNTTLNPRFNSAINPTFNSSLNPRFNSSINPRFNSSINPRFNSSINPRFNTSINPRFNSAINPRFNAGLNPRFNSTINPRLNSAFGGPYVYDNDLKQLAFTVRANDAVELLYSLNGEHIGQLVQANSEVRVRFDVDNKWTGYVVRANDDVSLVFSEAGDWVGLLV